MTVDSAFIRSCADSVRHLEVRVGNVETPSGGRRVFGAVAKAGTDILALVRCSLDAVGRTKDTALTAFTDGCPGLRRVLADAGVAEPPILVWFHIATRLQHLKQTASALPVDDPTRAEAKVVIVEEVERLHWRIWSGKARDAQVSIDRIREGRAAFPGRAGGAQVHRVITETTNRPVGTGRVSRQPERLAGQLRRAAPRGLAGRHRDH